MRHLAVRTAAATLVVLLQPVGTRASAQPPAAARVFSGAPAAAWIAPPGIPSDSFVVFHARRVFELTDRPARFLVHVSADNRYRLYVNGEQVSSGPQRSDVDHWRYETVDLAPRLRAGRNVIAALIWNWGAGVRPVAQHAWRTGFLLQGDGPAEATLVNSGPGWRLRVDSAYAPLAPAPGQISGYFASPPGDAIDGARLPWGWEQLAFRDDDWFTVPTGQSPASVGRLRLRAKRGGRKAGGQECENTAHVKDLQEKMSVNGTHRAGAGASA